MAGVLAIGGVPGGSGTDSVQSGVITAEAAAKTSGQCGKNVKWKYDSKTKTLTISGTGATYDFENSTTKGKGFASFPVKTVVVEKGVTKIGACMFEFMSSIESLKVANTVTEIGERAFAYASLKKSSSLPDSITKIGKQAFFYSSIVASPNFKIPSRLKRIEEGTFYNTYGDISNVKITVPNSVKYIGESAFGTGITLTVPDSVTYIGLYNCVDKIVGNTSTYVKQYAGDNQIPYVGKASSKTAVIYVSGELSDITNNSGTVDLMASSSSGGKLTYKSSNQKVVTVSSKGILTVQGTGKATITITCAKTKKCAKATRSVTVEVKAMEKGASFVYKDMDYCIRTTSKKQATVAVIGSEGDYSQQTITIPESFKIGGITYTVTSIGEYALSSRSSLKNIIIKSTKLKSIGNSAFDDIAENAVFTVPAKKLSAYRKMLNEDTGFTDGMTLKS
jgi:hypothetical protein